MKAPDKYIHRWLLSGCVLIFCMVVLGGITRLTGSGLSITEWNVILGSVPPLNEQEWNEAFDKYKQIPQYQQVNYHFTLQDFKKIYFWEYLHRLIGRVIGIVFLLPFLYFLMKRWMDRRFIWKVLFLFLLGALQGFLGWFMVQSGLSERTSVSHIRLAIHLLAAFITFGCTFWLVLDLRYRNTHPVVNSGLARAARWLLAVVLVQITYGAFTSGLHAGHIANTFPTMDGAWIPAGLTALSPGWRNAFENLLTVQFIHRCLAYLIVVLVIRLWWKVRREKLTSMSSGGVTFLLAAVLIQGVLGVSTLLTGVNIPLAVLHQAWAFFVFGGAVYTAHRFRSVPAAV